MARIYPISDIHLEFSTNPTKTLLELIPIDLDVDVVIVAGDLCCLGSGLYRALSYLEDRDYHTLFIPGNHEAYNSSIGAIHEFAAAWNGRASHVHILDNRLITLDGITYAGGTMWFESTSSTRELENRINDYTHIHNCRRDIPVECEIFQNWISSVGENADVIVTHHAPSLQSMSPRFRNSQLNDFYYNPIGDITLERFTPDLWIHGHTHHCCDYIHIPSGSRVIANPVGYPFETTNGFNPDLIVEI